MEFPHWLIIGGALLVFVGLIGTALKKRQRGTIRSALSKTGKLMSSPYPYRSSLASVARGTDRPDHDGFQSLLTRNLANTTESKAGNS